VLGILLPGIYSQKLLLNRLPADSIPMIPTQVEVQILTLTPRIPAEEVNRVKDQLREYTDRVTKGETTFATLARLYSEDPGTARQGGELGLTGRGMLDPAFAAVAFNLTDPRKISKIVETEFGYHIIQLIERRGEKVNCRHILLKPRISAEETEQAKIRLDSVANEVRSGKYAFETAVAYLSDDKDTRNNNGLMVNSSESSRTSRFRMQDLPTEVARVVEKMQVGDLSDAFVMTNSRGKTVCALVKLKNRIDAHRASITEDFQAMKDIVMAHLREERIKKWVADKIKDTYVRMSPEYQNCNFEYEGWMK
jgi:peptidyl-prolyl cis-trans isomerase SurA